MSEKAAVPEAEVEKKPGMVKMLLIPLVVGVLCAGLGFSVPILVPGIVGGEAHHEEPEAPPPPEPRFVSFGNVTVNLNESRMNRYLRLKITLQLIVPPEMPEEELTLHVEGKKAVMTSWLIGHLADLQMDDIRGAAGQNRLRREIHDTFNAMLFPEGEGQVEDVLFEEFNVQ